jgi:hypothetical protein
MDTEAYEQWELDSYAWDWIASQLNLTIVGDWVDPIYLMLQRRNI